MTESLSYYEVGALVAILLTILGLLALLIAVIRDWLQGSHQ